MSNRLDGCVVLVVDDDIDVLEGIDLALRADGAETLRAEDGNQAIAVWRTATPAVVVLDYDAAQAIRISRARGTPSGR